jgi:hypothetical protein
MVSLLRRISPPTHLRPAQHACAAPKGRLTLVIASVYKQFDYFTNNG